MSCVIEQAQAIEQAPTVDSSQASAQWCTTAEADQPPPMTAEAARRLAAVLAPHLLAMRAVTAGTRYATCANTRPGAADSAAAGTAAEVHSPPVSAATTIFIAGMLERISA